MHLDLWNLRQKLQDFHVEKGRDAFVSKNKGNALIESNPNRKYGRICVFFFSDIDNQLQKKKLQLMYKYQSFNHSFKKKPFAYKMLLKNNFIFRMKDKKDFKIHHFCLQMQLALGFFLCWLNWADESAQKIVQQPYLTCKLILPTWPPQLSNAPQNV